MSEPSVSDFAVTGVVGRPVSHERFLQALLYLTDHYVPEELWDLKAHVGVESRTGMAIVLRGLTPPASIPTGFEHRTRVVDDVAYHVMFWKQSSKRRSWAGRYPHPYRAPEVVEPIRRAVADWSTQEVSHRHGPSPDVDGRVKVRLGHAVFRVQT